MNTTSTTSLKAFPPPAEGFLNHTIVGIATGKFYRDGTEAMNWEAHFHYTDCTRVYRYNTDKRTNEWVVLPITVH